MNNEFFQYALNTLDNMSDVELMNSLHKHGIKVKWKVVPSRNQREGHYGGKLTRYESRNIEKCLRDKLVWKKHYRIIRPLSLKGIFSKGD